MKVIECNELSKAYKSKLALNKLSFSIEENKITGLIGRNGAGKTTLLKTIAGYIKKTSGDIKVFEKNPFNSIEVSANMIFVDDNMTFPQALNLEELLEEVSKFYRNWDMKLAKGLFEYFSLSPKQYHSRLSKGMKSTFNMILGLSSRAPLTIFDEPTTGMDASVRKDFYRALLKDYINHPRTFIISSHHLNEIEDVLEDILLIKDGEKCIHLPITDLKEMALGIKGKTELVNEFTNNSNILHIESFGMDSTYAVTKNIYNENELQRMRNAGLEIVTISADDICIYLTDKSREGIDYVFRRD